MSEEDRDYAEAIELMVNGNAKKCTAIVKVETDKKEDAPKPTPAPPDPLPRLGRVLFPIDYEFLYVVREHGGVSNWWLNSPRATNKEYKEAWLRCKRRGLIECVHKKSARWYDLSDLGLTVLAKHLDSLKPAGSPTVTNII
jgi:hypothetical protein